MVHGRGAPSSFASRARHATFARRPGSLLRHAPTPTPTPTPNLVAVKVMEKHNVPTLERMLEFIYTNRVEALKECSAHEVLDLLSAAEEYLLPDLKKVS